MSLNPLGGVGAKFNSESHEPKKISMGVIHLTSSS